MLLNLPYIFSADFFSVFSQYPSLSHIIEKIPDVIHLDEVPILLARANEPAQLSDSSQIYSKPPLLNPDYYQMLSPLFPLSLRVQNDFFFFLSWKKKRKANEISGKSLLSSGQTLVSCNRIFKQKWILSSGGKTHPFPFSCHQATILIQSINIPIHISLKHHVSWYYHIVPRVPCKHHLLPWYHHSITVFRFFSSSKEPWLRLSRDHPDLPLCDVPVPGHAVFSTDRKRKKYSSINEPYCFSPSSNLRNTVQWM